MRRTLADDEVVGNLLVLHDLHPDDVDTRVQAALERVRPYLGSHAGGVSLSGVDEQGVVHLQLEGSCDGCPSSALTVQSAIEDAILLAAPDVVAVEAEGMVEPLGPALLQIQPSAPHAERLGARPAAGSTSTRRASAHHCAGSTSAGHACVVANLDGTLVAYLDRCPACRDPAVRGVARRRPADLPRLCHGYDVRLAGPRRSADGEHLTPCRSCLSTGRGRCRSHRRAGGRMTAGPRQRTGPPPPDGQRPDPAAGGRGALRVLRGRHR